MADGKPFRPLVSTAIGPRYAYSASASSWTSQSPSVVCGATGCARARQLASFGAPYNPLRGRPNQEGENRCLQRRTRP
jgi:hypothetical protein